MMDESSGKGKLVDQSTKALIVNPLFEKNSNEQIEGVDEATVIEFRGRNSKTAVEKRLDRVMGNSLWHTRFSQATLTNLVAPVSDHNPILDLDILSHLHATGETLQTWGEKADSKFRLAKKELERQIKFLQSDWSSAGKASYRRAREELSGLLVQEDTFWRQRAKIFRLRDGNLNIRFFH
ncbi:hypothetical protein ACS0TY_013218 [Phlomoides rotata]